MIVIKSHKTMQSFFSKDPQGEVVWWCSQALLLTIITFHGLRLCHERAMS